MRSTSPLAALHDYALIADGERGALVGPAGDLAWMCFPGWADEALFAGLHLGPGSYAVRPEGPFVWGGYYEEGTLIWHSRWSSLLGIAECLEALAMPARPHVAVVLRRLRAAERRARLRVTLEPSPGFGRQRLELKRGEGGCFTWRGRGLHLRWSGAQGARVDADRLELRVDLEPGQIRGLMLEISTQPFRELPPLPEALWFQTRRAWAEAVPRLAQLNATRDARTSAAVLVGLTTLGGGMVAAATPALPERADRGRNYDYRYCWIRDQCYAGLAAAEAGMGSLLGAAVSFVSARLLADGPELKPVYTPSGGPVPDEHPLPLPGYPGVRQVRSGNRAGQQFQLDCLGEALVLLARAARRDSLGREGWRAARIAARAIARRCAEADAGIWELAPARYTHSRLLCAAGLRQWAHVQGGGGQARGWLALADHLVRQARARATRGDGAWRRAEGDDRVDAALLAPAFRGAFAGREPRTDATLRAIERELMQEGFVFRFRHGAGPLGESEGAFLLCQFWLAMAYLKAGERESALRAFERGRGASGSPGLFSEEYDVDQRQQRGNLPQAFVHAALLEAATHLG